MAGKKKQATNQQNIKDIQTPVDTSDIPTPVTKSVSLQHSLTPETSIKKKFRNNKT